MNVEVVFFQTILKAVYLNIKEEIRSSINRLFAYCKGGNLIFISGRGSAILTAKEGKSGFIFNLVKSLSAFWAAQTCVRFMKVLTVYTLTSHVLTLKAYITKGRMFLLSAETF